MRRPIVAGNWKMHLLREEAAALIRQLRSACEGDTVEVLVCPAFTALSAAAEALRGSRIGLGAQNLHWEPQGAFTGEVSGRMLADAGCTHVIIGHSERRTHFGETDETVRRKLAAARTHKLQLIVCIGETLAQRDAGQTFDILKRQLEGALGDQRPGDAGALILAYEPVWAIGTGRNATPEQAQEAHAYIRGWMRQRFGAEAAGTVRIQYGGSVTAVNAAALLQQPDVDGALVGGASLKADSFAAIVKAAADAKSVVPGTQTA
jgi:triosephosphate isomerase